METEQLTALKEKCHKGVNVFFKMKPSEFTGMNVITFHRWLENTLGPYIKELEAMAQGQLKF